MDTGIVVSGEGVTDIAIVEPELQGFACLAMSVEDSLKDDPLKFEENGYMDIIDSLVNKSIIKIGRAGDLCWIILGETIIDKNALGSEKQNEGFSLHLQCPWRISDTVHSIIKLASGDIYEPCSNIDWTEDFDWDIQGNNLFDEKVIDLFPKETSVWVKNVFIGKNGDLTIYFSNSLVLECFVNVSTNQECWRFFKHGDKKHLVIFEAY